METTITVYFIDEEHRLHYTEVVYGKPPLSVWVRKTRRKTRRF